MKSLFFLFLLPSIVPAAEPVALFNGRNLEGWTFDVWVNGVFMNEGSGLSATKGAICLQSEGGEIHFHKVELTPLE